MNKKILSAILVLFYVLSFNFGVFAGVVEQKSNMEEAANSLASKGIINNHQKDPVNYHLYDNVLRQEIAAVSRGVAGLDKKTKCDNIFDDLTATTPNSWACFSVEALVDNNKIAKNKTFRPEDKITKAEALGMLIKSIGFDYNYDPNNKKSWQEQIVNYSHDKGIVDNFTDYDVPATRGWIFIVADTTIKKEKEIKKIKDDKVYSDEAL